MRPWLSLVLRLVVGAVILWPGAALAQRQAGSLVGRIVDAEGAGLNGITVTLNGPRGVVTGQTDSRGDYRFPALDPGTYAVKAALPGFGAQTRTGIEVGIAKQAVVNLTLDVAAMAFQEHVEVEKPRIDASSSAFDDGLSQDLLFRMPFRRTATRFINNAPDVHDDSAHGGDAQSANALLLDGVEFRDPSSGAPFVFLNYNWVDQLQVMGPGAPAEYGLFTGALFNSVTRSGGNQWSGLFDVLYSRSRTLETDVAAEEPDRTTRYSDVSAQLGGPLVRDRLFFFVGAQRRRIETDPGGPRTVATNTSPRLMAKLSYRPADSDDFAFLIESDGADLTGFGDAPSDDLTSTIDSPDLVTSFRWSHAFGELRRTLTELKYTGWSGYFDQYPVRNVPGGFDVVTEQQVGSAGRFFYNDRSRWAVDATVSHYAEAFGRHNFRFGLEIERSRARYRGGYVDDIYLLERQGVPVYGYSYGYEVAASSERNGVYAQDTWQVTDRLTINPGLRLDWIRGTGPRTGAILDTKNLQPRLGVAFDLTGRGDRVLKAHVGRYSEASLTEIWRRALPGYREQILYALPNRTDLLTRVPLLRLSNDYSIDPDLRYPRVDEAVAGFEGLFWRDLRVMVAGLWRRFDNTVGTVMPAEVWTPTAGVNPLDGSPLTFYSPSDATPNVTRYLITNPDGFEYRDPQGNVLGVASADRSYRALLVSISKPFSRGWLLQASYVLAKGAGDVDSQITLAERGRFGKYDDPSSALTFTNGELNLSRRHEVKAMLAYEVPRIGVSLGGYLRVLSGQHYAALSVSRHSAARPVFVTLLEPRGSRVLPTATTLDLRVEKHFEIGPDGGRLGLYVDATNLFDARTVTDVHTCLGDACPDGGEAFGAPLTVVAPRQWAFGARWSF